jgi:hypothetical protein
VSIEVFIDGSTLQYERQGGRDAVDCELTTVIFDKSGKSTNVVTDKVQGALTADKLALAKQQGYRYVKQFELKPGIYQARVGVRDSASERIGTANTWVEVPSLRRTGVALSSVLLNRLQTEGDKNSKTQGPELFAPGVKQGIATFKQGASLAYQLTVYDKSTRKPEELELLVQSEVMEGDQPLYRSDWKPVNERLVGVSATGFDVGGQINLDIKPGIYELRITVKHRKTNRTARQTVMFEVEG